MSILEQIGTSKLVYVRSKDRTPDSEGTTNFKVNLGASSELHQIKRLVLRSAHIPNTMYNIRAGVNNELDFQFQGTDYQIQLQEGFYSTSLVISTIQSLINVIIAPATVTVTQNPINSKIILEFSTSVGRLNFNPLSYLLGVTYNISPSSPFEPQDTPKLWGLSRVLLQSRELAPANLMDSNGNLNNILLNIPIRSVYGTINHYEPADDEIASINYQTARDIRQIDIKLIDDEEQTIDLRDNEVEFVFKVYF